MPDKAIEVLLEEGRSFPPPESFKTSANIRSSRFFAQAKKDPEGFWAKAAEELEWIRPWDKVLEWDCPRAKWFIGGRINASCNCLDRHVKRLRDLTDLPSSKMSV